MGEEEEKEGGWKKNEESAVVEKQLALLIKSIWANYCISV